MKRILTICTAAALTIADTGCAAKEKAEEIKESVTQLVSPTETPEKLIIISGYHSNGYIPDWTLIQDKIFNACSKNAEIQLIVDDGKPFVKSINLEKVDTSLSDKNFNERVKQNTAKVIAECMTTTARTEEIDTYSALALADRCIDTNAENSVLIIDSMLPTTGQINFAETPLVSVDIESSVKSFENSFQNLNKSDITVYGLGEVAGEQPDFSTDDYNTLCAFWDGFFEETNCEFYIDRSPYTVKENPENLPKVSVCLTTEDTSKMTKLGDNTVYELPPSAISFNPDSAKFTDRETAKKELSDFAEKLTDSDKLVLHGMTATYGDAESSRTLSLERAEAVKELLLEIGVKSQITCIGTGFDPNPLHTPDLNADGSLNESNAEKNRTVLAMTETTAKNYGLL